MFLSLADALVAAYLKWLATALQPYWPPRAANPPTIQSHREVLIMQVPGGHYDLDPPTDVDPSAVLFNLVGQVDGKFITPIPYDPANPPANPVSVEAVYDTKVRVGWQALDKKGNATDPDVFLDFTATDDIPPGPADGPTVAAHREVMIEVPDQPTPP